MVLADWQTVSKENAKSVIMTPVTKQNKLSKLCLRVKVILCLRYFSLRPVLLKTIIF